MAKATTKVRTSTAKPTTKPRSRSVSTTSTRKPTVAKPSVAKPKVAKPTVAKPTVEKPVLANDASEAGDVLRKRAVVEAAVSETGMKRGEVRAVVDAIFSFMGKSLEDGAKLNIPPLGKIRVARVHQAGDDAVLTCKIRRKAARTDVNTPLATPAE